jgi:hypothetical protein
MLLGAQPGLGHEIGELALPGADTTVKVVRALERVKQLKLEDQDLLRFRQLDEGACDLTELEERGVVGVHDWVLSSEGLGAQGRQTARHPVDGVLKPVDIPDQGQARELRERRAHIAKEDVRR